MLASWRTFGEYKLHQNGHVRNLWSMTMMIANFILSLATFYPHKGTKHQKVGKNIDHGSFFHQMEMVLCSLHFVRVRVDQIRDVSTWELACLNLKSFCQVKEMPLLEMKICHSVKPNQISCLSAHVQTRVKKPQTFFKLNSLGIETRAKIFARENRHLIRKIIKKASDTFISTLKCTKEEQLFISGATKEQSKNEDWHKMRHLMVTGKKIKAIYTRQKTKDCNLSTVSNFLKLKNNFIYSNAMQYGTDKKRNLYIFTRDCVRRSMKKL